MGSGDAPGAGNKGEAELAAPPHTLQACPPHSPSYLSPPAHHSPGPGHFLRCVHAKCYANTLSHIWKGLLSATHPKSCPSFPPGSRLCPVCFSELCALTHPVWRAQGPREPLSQPGLALQLHRPSTAPTSAHPPQEPQCWQVSLELQPAIRARHLRAEPQATRPEAFMGPGPGQAGSPCGLQAPLLSTQRAARVGALGAAGGRTLNPSAPPFPGGGHSRDACHSGPPWGVSSGMERACTQRHSVNASSLPPPFPPS